MGCGIRDAIATRPPEGTDEADVTFGANGSQEQSTAGRASGMSFSGCRQMQRPDELTDAVNKNGHTAADQRIWPNPPIVTKVAGEWLVVLQKKIVAIIDKACNSNNVRTEQSPNGRRLEELWEFLSFAPSSHVLLSKNFPT